MRTAARARSVARTVLSLPVPGGMSVSPAAAALLVIGLVTAIRVSALFLSGLELDGDEAQYWTWAQQPAFGYYSKPPLIAWLIAASTAVCGDGEGCVRLASPLLHALTSGVLFLFARRLFDDAVAFWAALAYLTLPGVWFSAGLITTDAPLLFFWSVALLAFHSALAGSRRAAAALGLAIGLGMLSKYAMLYFVGSAVLFCLLTPSARGFLTSRPAALAAAIAAAIVAPNVWWNLQNGLATVAHTAGNAGWSGSLFHPARAADFFAAQFGVFGPIMMATLLWICWSARRYRLSPELRLLLFFALPVLVLVTGQGLLSRAYANWGAVAYPSATVAVAAWLVYAGRTGLLKLSVGVHVTAALALYALATGAVSTTRLGIPDPLAKVRGWEAMAQQVEAYLDARPGAVVLVEERMLVAELSYYLRDRSPTIRMWSVGRRPANHYALTAPLRPGDDAEVLFLTRHDAPDHITGRFASSRLLGAHEIRAGTASLRTLSVYLLNHLQSEDTYHAYHDDRSP